MTKRIVWALNENQFKYFLMSKVVEIDSIEEEELKKGISTLSPGCFVLAIKLKGGNVEALSMHKFPKSCNMMVSREHMISLHLRFLTPKER
jgi:hypothetical protein